MWTADTIGFRGNTEYIKAYEGNELVWEKQVGPPNNEIWYTSTDNRIVNPYQGTQLPTLVSNTYRDGKGVMTFASDVVIVNGFYTVTKLKTITLPNSVITLWGQAFKMAYGLVTAYLPNSLTRVGGTSFQYCRRLYNIDIPNSVNFLGMEAFDGCTSLKYVNIGTGVTEIASLAFGACTALTNITYAGTIAQWNAITKASRWYSDVLTTVVHCIDGDTPI